MFAPTSRLLAALPVSVAEFRESLASIWLPRVRVQSPRLGEYRSDCSDMALSSLLSFILYLRRYHAYSPFPLKRSL